MIQTSYFRSLIFVVSFLVLVLAKCASAHQSNFAKRHDSFFPANTAEAVTGDRVPGGFREHDDDEDDDHCSLDFQSAYHFIYRGAYSRGYSPEHQTAHSESLPFSIGHAGNECDYRVLFRPVNGRYELNNGNDSLSYHLSLETQGVLRPGELIDMEGSFSSDHGEHYNSLVLELPRGQRVTSGVYTSNLSVLVYQPQRGQDVLIDSRNILISTVVTPFVKASFDSGKTRATLDFGNLNSRQEMALQINIEANTRYSMYVSSAHGGHLRHEYSDTLLPYSFYIRGENVPLSSAPYKLLTSQHKVASENLPIRFNYTPESGTHLAGKYKDRIEIRIVAD